MCPRLSGLLETSRRTGVWPDSVQVLGGLALYWAAHPSRGCGSLPVCSPPGAVTRRGSRGDCPARSSNAHLAVHYRHERRREQRMEQVIIGVDPHKLSATIEVVDDHEQLLGLGPVHHRPGRLRGDAERTPRPGRTGSGRSRAPTVSAGRWRSGCSRPASTSSTSRPSSPPGSGCSTPATTARPTPSTRTRSPSSRSAPRTCGCCKVDGELEAMRMLTDRREALTRRRVQTVCRLQALLAELLPGQAKTRHHHRPGQGDARLGAPARHRRQDPPPDRRRRAGRADRGRGEDQEGHRRAQGDGPGPRTRG